MLTPSTMRCNSSSVWSWADTALSCTSVICEFLSKGAAAHGITLHVERLATSFHRPGDGVLFVSVKAPVPVRAPAGPRGRPGNTGSRTAGILVEAQTVAALVYSVCVSVAPSWLKGGSMTAARALGAYSRVCLAR
jgi:hypothetical protein